MPDIKWVKITTEMFDDEKIRIIESMPEADTLIVLWIRLICMAGKNNDSGYIYLTPEIPYSIEQLAAVFVRPLNTVKLAIETFLRLGMITRADDGRLFLPAFEKHQNIVGMEKIRETTRKRVAAFRKRQQIPQQTQQIQAQNKLVTLQSVTVTHHDIDKIRLDKIRLDKSIYTEQFEIFWKAYPRKKNKGQAEKSFKKIAPDEQLMATILTAIEQAEKSADWLKDSGQYIPYPSTWLNAKGWEDEYPEGGQNGAHQASSGKPRPRALPTRYSPAPKYPD